MALKIPSCMPYEFNRLITMIVLACVSSRLDKAEPVEWARFRKGSSCMEHIQNTQVAEVHRELRLSLVLTFVDYGMALDNVEKNAILSTLIDQGVDSFYVKPLPWTWMLPWMQDASSTDV